MVPLWQFYGVNEGTAIFFGNKDEGKFGSYWVKDGKVRTSHSCKVYHSFLLCVYLALRSTQCWSAEPWACNQWQ